MAGNPANARLWTEADVYVAFNLTTANPASGDAVFGAGWSLVGLLDGDAGFTDSRDEDVTDHFAWGGVLMMTGRQHFKLTKSFTAFEDNSTTRALRWPGSPAGSIVVPRPGRVKIAFETRYSGIVHRLISKYQAEVNLDGDVTENESDPASLAFVATIFPDSAGVLFVEQTSTTFSS